MSDSTLPPRPGWHTRASALAVIVFLCLPLFISLKQWDLRNDESIYSYAVDRILETGNWLTPRSIPTDEPFLEKPPLKFWLVAAAIRVGLLPWNEVGMRFLDAVFGAAAFLYVFVIGRRMAGPLAGLAAAFVLFMFEPMQLEHGIRGNNMEAALILAYAGGVYHFFRWVESGDVKRRRRHALVIGGYFTLAFMTKFVAALFLPMIAVASLVVRPKGWRLPFERWRDWLWPSVFALAAIVPWFVYQAIHTGSPFFRIIFGEHVYARFTASLDASHVFPWHQYFTSTWMEFEYSGIRWISAIGLLTLVIRAVRSDWLARLMLLWWLLPFALMSLGTSKLYHYAYPFLAPLAIGAGIAAAWLLSVAAVPERLVQGRVWPSFEGRRGSRIRQLLGWTGAAALLIAALTAVYGPILLELGGVRLFSNSSALRPAVAGIVMWIIAGRMDLFLMAGSVATVVLLLPISTYPKRIDRLQSIDHPLQTTRDCALRVHSSGAPTKDGILHASGDLHHGFYYYLRHLGRWRNDSTIHAVELHLQERDRQTPVILSKEDYLAIGGKLPERASSPAPDSRLGLLDAARAAGRIGPVPAGILISDYIVILFPGPFAQCVEPVVQAGAWELPAR